MILTAVVPNGYVNNLTRHEITGLFLSDLITKEYYERKFFICRTYEEGLKLARETKQTLIELRCDVIITDSY